MVSADLHLLQFLLLVREFDGFVRGCGSELVPVLALSLFAFSTLASLAILTLIRIFCSREHTHTASDLYVCAPIVEPDTKDTPETALLERVTATLYRLHH